ncbi:MAG: nucleotide exchange factor GrpE [Proteobacteria bacterium]|nr:nucleotide exchange factor GrpE [Pseudomonadota bacterium]
MTQEKKVPNSDAGDENDEQVVTDIDNGDDKEVQDPTEQIAELSKKLAATHDRLIRTTAELDNVRKRSRRDIEEATVRGRIEVLRAILPVIDSIDLALSSANPEGTAVGIIEGIEMVRKQFLNATDHFQLKPIESVGHGFDPNFHEAVAQLESDKHPAGQIMDEMRKGYLLGERLLRAAMVVVSKGSSEPSKPEDDTTSNEHDARATDDLKSDDSASEIESRDNTEINTTASSEIEDENE